MPEQLDLTRIRLLESFEQEFRSTLDAQVERYLETNHHSIVADSPFAPASSECIALYRLGLFYGCISLCQAVGEALVRHMCQSNRLTPASSFERNLRILRKCGHVNDDWVSSAEQLWQQRDDYHHLNPTVARAPAELRALALEKIAALASLERWVFEYTVHDGKPHPLRPQYWLSPEPGKLSVYLRLQS